MKHRITILATIAVLAFVALGINNLVSNNQKLRLQNLQIKTKTDTIQQLEFNHDSIQDQLKTEKEKGNQNEQKVKELEQKDLDNQKKIDDLEAQVQAQLEKKRLDAERLASANRALTLTATASAASNNGSAKMFIYMHESGNNPGAINKSSGACGLGQALPCSKLPCSLSDYACQDSWFTNYMLQRYGSWENAKAFWQSHRWW